MKRILCFLITLCTCCSLMHADYTDIPYTISGNGQFTVDGYTFSTKTGYYQEWDHYVVFWSTGYGQRSGTVTTIGSGDYLLNLAGMKEYAEMCYEKYTSLGFLDPTSADGGGHKIIILAYYSTDWYATGSGLKSGNDIYGVLNISHASANPSVNYYTYCHEIAHAYQYLGYAKNGGNAGFNYESGMYGWVSYYECCGNWQAAQEYPALYFPQCYQIFNKTTNLTFPHAWHSYQCYPLNDYLTEKCGQTAVGDIWTINTGVAYAEPLEKYMAKYGKSAADMYRDVFMAAMRMVTWDLTRWQTYLTAEGKTQDAYMNHKAGTKASKNSATTTPATYNDNCYATASTYQYVTTNSNQAIHQVAYSSAPQSSGFNVIPLNVPSGSNRTVTTKFTALQSGASLASGDNKEYWDGDNWATSSKITKYNTGVTAQSNSTYNEYKTWRGFRLGYVTYKKSTGKRYYNYLDKVYCTGTEESSVNISFDVPEDVDSLYLVVSPALSQYLRNESSGNYDADTDAKILAFQQSFDQWPYRVQFYNTNIYGLTNPSTSFSGSAEVGNTYTSAELTDLEQSGTVEPENPDQPDEPDEPDEPEAQTGNSVHLQKLVSFAPSSDYSGTTLTLSESDLNAIGACFGVSGSEVKNTSNWEEWNASGPSEGKMTLWIVDPTDKITLENSKSTANGYGHWMTKEGKVCTWGNGSYVYSEYDVSSATFALGQYPGNLQEGDTPSFTQAIVYNANGTQKIAYVHVYETITSESSASTGNITLSPTQTTLYSTGVQYDNIYVGRTFKAGYSTICVPFDIEEVVFEYVFGANAYVASFAGAEENDGVWTLTFSNGKTVRHNKPYLIYIDKDEKPDGVANPAFIEKELYYPLPAVVTTESGWSFTGNYTPGKSMNGLYGVANNSSIMKGGATSTINAYTAYLTGPVGASAKIMVDGETTAVIEISADADAAVQEIFTLEGNKTDRFGKGICIVKMRDGSVRKVINK